MENIIESLKEKGANVNLVVSIKDLEEWGKHLISAALDEVKEEEKFLTPTQVAKMLDTTRSTLWRWDKNNYLKPVYIGGKPRYKESDIKSLLGLQ